MLIKAGRETDVKEIITCNIGLVYQELNRAGTEAKRSLIRADSEKDKSTQILSVCLVLHLRGDVLTSVYLTTQEEKYKTMSFLYLRKERSVINSAGNKQSK